jgi:hypothetical protein
MFDRENVMHIAEFILMLSGALLGIGFFLGGVAAAIYYFMDRYHD